MTFHLARNPLPTESGRYEAVIYLKKKFGGVEKMSKRFATRAGLPIELNRLMDTGKYVSCGASIGWVVNKNQSKAPACSTCCTVYPPDSGSTTIKDVKRRVVCACYHI